MQFQGQTIPNVGVAGRAVKIADLDKAFAKAYWKRFGSRFRKSSPYWPISIPR